MTVDNAPPKAGRREWIALAVLVLPTLLVTMDLNVLFLALPHIAADLHAGPAQQLWITDIYGFLVAGFTVTMGNVGDRFGRRKVLLTGATVFMVASVLCAFANSVAMLIIARGLLGIAGATLTPLTLALIFGMFQDPKQMGTALGIWASALGGGVVLGPPVGGILMHSFWWGSVFLVAVPIMLVLILAGRTLLPESKNPDGGRIDLLSVGLFLVALLPAVQALKDFARAGWGARPVILLAVGVVGIVLFIRRQLRIPNPLLDVRLFKNKVIRSGTVMFLSVGLLAGATGLVVALYMQLVQGLSVLAAGLWMLPPCIIGLIFSNIAPKFAAKVRPAHVIGGGMLIGVAGELVLTQVSVGGGLALLIIGLGVVLIGTSPVGPVANQAVMSSAPPESLGAIGGLSATSGELGAALGVAVFGSIATAVYRGDVNIPAGTPGDVADAAGRSISEAVAVAGNLPAGPARDGLLSAAHSAFASGLNIVALIAAAGFAVVAAIAWSGLGKIPAFGAGHHGGEAPAEQPEGDADTDQAAA